MNSSSFAGALAANARRDVHAHAARMRRAYRDSFLVGHGCRLCPRIDIPADAPGGDRERRAAALWRLHWHRMRRQRRSTGRRALDRRGATKRDDA
jgi:hypothetical protein